MTLSEELVDLNIRTNQFIDKLLDKLHANADVRELVLIVHTMSLRRRIRETRYWWVRTDWVLGRDGAFDLLGTSGAWDEQAIRAACLERYGSGWFVEPLYDLNGGADWLGKYSGDRGVVGLVWGKKYGKTPWSQPQP